jgi:hypothetical protein
MSVTTPEPVPLLLELDDDHYVLHPRAVDPAVRSAGVAKMLAMTAEERLDWHERWRRFIKACQRRGYSIQQIEAAVYGATPTDEPG